MKSRKSADQAIGEGKLAAHPGVRNHFERLVRLRDAEPETGCAELDIYLGEKEYWGRGYAADAMRTICRYGFEKMRLHKITLTR